MAFSKVLASRLFFSAGSNDDENWLSSGVTAPVFAYDKPVQFFKQFKRYARVVNLSASRCHDLLCYTFGTCARSRWLAHEVEAKVVGGAETTSEEVINLVEQWWSKHYSQRY